MIRCHISPINSWTRTAKESNIELKFSLRGILIESMYVKASERERDKERKERSHTENRENREKRSTVNGHGPY